VGLGLPGLKPGCSLSVVREAVAQNDNILTKQQMLRDKIKATVWEATNEAIKEQVGDPDNFNPPPHTDPGICFYDPDPSNVLPIGYLKFPF